MPLPRPSSASASVPSAPLGDRQTNRKRWWPTTSGLRLRSAGCVRRSDIFVLPIGEKPLLPTLVLGAMAICSISNLEGLRGKIGRQHEVGLLRYNKPVYPRHILLRPVRVSGNFCFGLFQVVVILICPDMHHLVQLSDITVVPASELDAVFLPDRQR